MGAIVRWIVSKISAYLTQLAAEVAAYEKEKAEKEAEIAELRKGNAILSDQIVQEKATRVQLDAQLATEKAAINETEQQLKDALAPKDRPVLSDDAELERLSSRTN